MKLKREDFYAEIIENTRIWKNDYEAVRGNNANVVKEYLESEWWRFIWEPPECINWTTSYRMRAIEFLKLYKNESNA